MASWKKDKLMKYQVCKLKKLKNYKLLEWQLDKMPS